MSGIQTNLFVRGFHIRNCCLIQNRIRHLIHLLRNLINNCCSLRIIHHAKYVKHRHLLDSRHLAHLLF